MKGLVNLGSKMMNITSQFEQTQKGLETVLQSAEKGKALFEDLRKFSFDTTFGIDELANASTQLLNVGESTNELQKDLKMLGDLAQGDKGKFAELTSILSKVQASGKASAMQLNQIALRGIPITQTLKKMGVTGTASAEELKKAFEELTGETGQFHNAMNNIIDTIEGKKGFISDTWKEILVNFGELSGVTDMYKSILDTLYKVLDNINNKLREWNENPVIKALIKGTIITAITGITGLLVGSLIPALATVVGLMGAINPAVWIGGAIGVGVGVLGSAINNAKKNNPYQQIEDEVKSITEQYGVSDINVKNARKNAKKGKISDKERLAIFVDEYQNSLQKEKEYEMLIDTVNYSEEELAIVKQKLATQKQITDEYFELVKNSKEEIDIQEALAGKTMTNTRRYEIQTEQFNKMRESLGSIYNEENEVGKLMKELIANESQLSQLQDKVNKTYIGNDGNGRGIRLELTEEEKSKFEKDIKTLMDKNRTIEIEIAVKSQKDWQKILQSAFGFSGEDIKNGATNSTVGALNYYLEKVNANNNKLMNFADLLGIDKNTIQEKLVQELKDIFQALISSDKWNGTEESLRQFQIAIEKLENETNTFAEKLNIWSKNQLKNGNVAGGVAGGVAGNLIGQSSDIQNFMQGFSSGGLIGGLVNSIIGALTTVISEVDGLNDVLNPMTMLLRTTKPLLQEITNIILAVANPVLRLLTSVFEKLADVCDELFIAISPIISLIDMLVDSILNIVDAVLLPIKDVLRTFGEIIGAVVELLRPIFSILQVITKTLVLIDTPFKLLAGLVKGFADLVGGLMKPFEDSLNGFMEWIDNFLGIANEELDEKKTQEELLKKLNNQYSELLESIKEQEEYYLKEKTKINADSYIDSVLGNKRVNDMILTPEGRFSTHPDDTIIAMKHPEDLSRGGVTIIQPIINNNASDSVDVQIEERNNNGISELVVNISRKIAQDYANGNNGWDSAYSLKQRKLSGRSVIG